jgi:hypothetical protein
MSTPLDVLPNSTILSRISQELPALFSIDPLPQNAISFARIHPQPISIISIEKPYTNTIVVKHATTNYFKNYAFGSSVFLSAIPYDLSYALANNKKDINAIWDINEYSSEGVFSLSSPDFSSIVVGAVFTGNIYQNTYVTGTVSTTVCTLNVSSLSSGRISIGQQLSGTGIISGTKIIANGTGTGGTGTYYLDIVQTASSTTIISSCKSGYINIAKISRQNFISAVSSRFDSFIYDSSYSLFSEESKGDPSIYVSDASFSLSSSCSYFVPEYIDLADYSLKQFVEYFQEKYDEKIVNGYGGIKVNYSNELEYGTHLPSTLLLEGGLDIDANDISWPIFTNNNFKFLIPLVLMIKDYKLQIQAAAQQTNQHIATDEWLEYWGKILNVPRQTSEIDMDEMYRARMQREALLPKSNNLAIAELVTSATGQSSAVVDGSSPFQIIFPSTDKLLKTTPFNRTSSYLPYTKTNIISPWKTTEAIFNGSITGSVLTVPANIATGGIATNSTAWTVTHSAGYTFPVGAQVTLSGLTPSAYNGTYTVASSTATTFTISNTANPGAVTVAGAATVGTISVGHVLSGPGITAGTRISSQATGTTGGIGTYNLAASQVTNIATGGITTNGTLWTVTHTSGDQFTAGTSVTLSGLTPTAYNGTYTVNTSPVATIATGGITTNGTLWTVTHSAGYQFPVGAKIIVSGITPTGYNGTHTVNTSLSATSFTIANTATPGAVTVAGTVTLSKESFTIANIAAPGAVTVAGRVASATISAIGKPYSITIGTVSSVATYYTTTITILGNVSIMDTSAPYYFPLTQGTSSIQSWSTVTVYGTSLTGSLGSGVVTITGTPSTSGITTTINIQSTGEITAGTLGSLGISYPAAVYNISTSTTTSYASDSFSNATRIGPVTGSGTFIVKVAPDDTINNILSPNLKNFVYTLVNKYKSAGVSFTVEPLLT